MSIDVQRIVDNFADSVGSKKARDLVEGAASTAGIELDDAISDDEAIEILDVIQDRDDASTYVRIAASTLVSQIRTERVA